MLSVPSVSVSTHIHALTILYGKQRVRAERGKGPAGQAPGAPTTKGRYTLSVKLSDFTVGRHT
jgi:hypothetical protein